MMVAVSVSACQGHKAIKKATGLFGNFVNRHLHKTEAMKLKMCFFCQESFVLKVCSINITCYIED